jgi:hypothetical protein
VAAMVCAATEPRPALVSSIVDITSAGSSYGWHDGGMPGYDAEAFEATALAGDWKAATAVLSRGSVKPEVLAALMTSDAHVEVVLGILSRQSVTPEHLAWAATFGNAQILGRVVSNPKTPTPLIREIRDRVAGREGPIWVHLREYADRVLTRIDRESGLRGGQ